MGEQRPIDKPIEQQASQLLERLLPVFEQEQMTREERIGYLLSAFPNATPAVVAEGSCSKAEVLAVLRQMLA